MAKVVEGRYAQCVRVTLALDNPNTHKKRAFNEMFEPESARELARRVQCCYAPRRGSWLHIAKWELCR